MDDVLEVARTARRTWATGDYDAMMAQEGLYAVGRGLVDRLDVEPGETLLDVACGTGNAAIPAAERGARVTGLDLTPEMLQVARRRAADAGAQVEWTEGDMERLPFGTGSFGVVVSTFGSMFAPHHGVAARELARVLAPGGRLGICSWTPDGAIGDFFRTVAPYLPPPPAPADPPLLWGDETYVSELFDGTGVSLTFERATWPIRHPSLAAAIVCYTTTFGPVVAARENADAEGRWPQLRRDLHRLFTRLDAAGDGTLRFPADYLVIIGRKDD